MQISRRMLMAVWVGLAVQFGGAPQVFADAKRFYFERSQSQNIENLKNDFGFFSSSIFPKFLFEGEEEYTTEEGVLLQLRDHFSERDPRTFPQRYWISQSNSQSANAPVFLYICGEATCDSSYMFGAVGAYARKFNAKVVALEHRYYGKSIPTSDLSNENLIYLSTAQALEDLNRFLVFLRAEGKIAGPVVVIGGSYAGSLSAYFRQKYPELVKGALASSAPVIAKANFEAYDRHVFEVAGTACAADLKTISDYFEARLADPALATESRAWFGAEKVVDDEDFLYLIADVSAAGIQYGMKTRLCNALAQAQTLDAKAQQYVKFAKALFASWGVSAYQFSVASGAETNPDVFLSGFGYRAWLYQSCTEYGYFQNSYHDATLTTRSTRINPAYHARLCDRLFGIRSPVAEAATNARYYAPLLSPLTASEIYFTNGADDPWNLLSITPKNGNALNSKNFLSVIPGAAHCDDLRGERGQDSNELRMAREQFVKLTEKWITQ